ncbi:MAG TPA: hypothetical protein P5118_24240 [Planctomycetota bacterium]|nr:hypothetical protein [Planctomycetota bacterium]
MSNVLKPRRPNAPSREASSRLAADIAAGVLTPAPGDAGAAAIQKLAQAVAGTPAALKSRSEPIAPPAAPQAASGAEFRLDPAATRVVVFTHGSYPQNALAVEIPLWLHANGLMGNLVALAGSPVERIRNEAMISQVLNAPRHLTDFIFCDSDQRPTAATDLFLRVPGDIVVCECPVPNMGTWADPQAFHCGLFRVRRHVIEAIKPPWFAFDLGPDGSRLNACECAHFAAKARAAGFSITRAGWCDHFKTFGEKG